MERARWLAELATALEEARKLLWEIGSLEDNMEAGELYVLIETLQVEIELLQTRRDAAATLRSSPNWTQSDEPSTTPWCVPPPAAA
jgi:hypothetical protein